MTRAAVAAAAFEIALVLCGAYLTWRHVFSRREREERAVRLAEWRLPAFDFAAFLCLAFAGAGAVGSLAGFLLRRAHLGPDAEMVAGGAAMHLGVLLGLGAFYLLYRARNGAPGGGPRAGTALKSGIVTFLIAVPLVDGASFAWQQFLVWTGLPVEQQDMVDIAENTGSAAVKWTLIAVATLLVPLTEEVVFRGGLFRYLRTRLPRWVAILSTSALFGALHVSWGEHISGLPSLVPLTVLAVIFCVAYERTGSIGTTIVAHALFNLNTFLLVAAGIGS
jgi:membrane protease YdiL (CAAX protease family)